MTDAMKEVSVKLNADDLWLIQESISANIPYDGDRTAKEVATADKLATASKKLRAALEAKHA
jgi:hypothetical protein